MSKNDLGQRLKHIVHQGGGDLFGVADITAAREFIVDQGGEVLAKFPRAVSIGMRLSDIILARHSPDERREDSLYWHHIYEVVTPALDFLARRVSRELQAEGYQAFPVPASLPLPNYFCNLHSGNLLVCHCRSSLMILRQW